MTPPRAICEGLSPSPRPCEDHEHWQIAVRYGLASCEVSPRAPRMPTRAFAWTKYYKFLLVPPSCTNTSLQLRGKRDGPGATNTETCWTHEPGKEPRPTAGAKPNRPFWVRPPWGGWGGRGRQDVCRPGQFECFLAKRPTPMLANDIAKIKTDSVAEMNLEWCRRHMSCGAFAVLSDGRCVHVLWSFRCVVGQTLCTHRQYHSNSPLVGACLVVLSLCCRTDAVYSLRRFIM